MLYTIGQSNDCPCSAIWCHIVSLFIRSKPGFGKHGRLCKSLNVYSNGFALSQRTSFEMTDQPLRDSRYIVCL
jgi:hypothetical protein